MNASDRVTTEHVVAHVRELIERGALGPGIGCRRNGSWRCRSA